MKNSFAYILIALLSSIFIFHFAEKHSPNIKVKLQIPETEADTSINKLPDGYLYINNFNLKKKHKVNSIVQDSSGLLLFSDNKSITLFDGKNEIYIPVEAGPEMIKKSPYNDTIYVACRNGFGILNKNNTGKIQYESLSNNLKFTQGFYSIIFGDQKVFFANSEKIVSLSQDDQRKINVEYTDPYGNIDHIFFYDNKLYLNIREKGFHYLAEDSVVKTTLGFDFRDKEIIFSISNNEKLFFGTNENKIFYYDGVEMKLFNTSSDEYIKESIITGGLDFNNDYIAVNTVNGGTLIINKENGETQHTINYRTGLPDDEVISSFVCQSNALWISHEYGISRVSFDIPIKNFGNYPGIQGKINTVKIVDSTLYVATGEGLFYLSEIKNFDEVKIATDKWVKSRVKITKNKPVNKSVIVVPEIEEDDEEEIQSDDEDSGFFKRWKNRKKKQKEDNTSTVKDKDTKTENSFDNNAIPEEEIPEKQEYSYKTEYKKVTEYRKIYELQSVKYSYKKIEGINSKCKELIEYDNGLLAVSNSGLYFIKGNQSETVIPDIYIHDISTNNNGLNSFVSTSEGLFVIKRIDGDFSIQKIQNQKSEYQKIKHIYKLTDSTLWASYRNNLFLLKIQDDRIRSGEYYSLNSSGSTETLITEFNNNIVFISNENAFVFNENLNNFSEESELKSLIQNADRIFFTSDSSFAVFLEDNSVININSKQLAHIKYSKLFNFTETLSFDQNDNIWVVSGDNMIYKIYPEETSSREFQLKIYDLTDVNGHSLKAFQNIKLKSDYKKLNIHLVSPCFLKRDAVQFYFGIDTENDEEYIKSSESTITIPELTPGNHIIYIYAVNEISEKSNVIKLNLSISPPFWQTNWFIIAAFSLLILILTLSVSGFYRRKQRKIREYNEVLEQKVKERTAEIEKQNKLIQQQNSEIIGQNKKIVAQNNEITGSIRYAGKIQSAALPEIDIYENHLNGFFILYKPRDIVSGDFYWISEIQNKFFVAAVDCTGHGVPGGFLSMLGISFLNEIVKDLSKKTDQIKAGDILTELRSKIIITLNQQADEMSRDGMDMALVIFDKEKMILNFAGANNPGYIIRKSRIHKLEADRMPIGYSRKLNDKPFGNKFLKVEKDDLIYLFSDGYADQFGGRRGKKFNTKRFRELLLHLQNFPMDHQKDIADKILQKWQKDNIQIDDILLIGLQI